MKCPKCGYCEEKETKEIDMEDNSNIKLELLDELEGILGDSMFNKMSPSKSIAIEILPKKKKEEEE